MGRKGAVVPLRAPKANSLISGGSHSHGDTHLSSDIRRWTPCPSTSPEKCAVFPAGSYVQVKPSLWISVWESRPPCCTRLWITVWIAAVDISPGESIPAIMRPPRRWCDTIPCTS